MSYKLYLQNPLCEYIHFSSPPAPVIVSHLDNFSTFSLVSLCLLFPLCNPGSFKNINPIMLLPWFKPSSILLKKHQNSLAWLDPVWPPAQSLTSIYSTPAPSFSLAFSCLSLPSLFLQHTRWGLCCSLCLERPSCRSSIPGSFLHSGLSLNATSQRHCSLTIYKSSLGVLYHITLLYFLSSVYHNLTSSASVDWLSSSTRMHVPWEQGTSLCHYYSFSI